MTAFAISSGGVEYYDQKTGGSTNATLDTYTVSNGSTLILRTDTYACLNHSAAFGSVDNIAFSGIGGEVIIDPTYVRHVAYSGGSGNSPAYGAAISQGGVSGVFLGAWQNWQSEPVAAGAAIPSAGFIKIGGVSGGSFSAGSLTGISATCSGADVQSWVEVRSAETSTITVPRVGKFITIEAWLELGVTNGTRGQVIECPTTGSAAGVFPCCWIETSPSSGVYEQFTCVGNLSPSSTLPSDERTKFFWQTTSGLVIGFDGVNNVGFLPTAGCRVRIPAVIFTNVTRSGSGSGPRVVPNATMGTRSEFVTTASGFIDIRGAIILWYANFDQTYYVKLKSCGIGSALILQKIGSAFYIDDIAVVPVQAQEINVVTVKYNPQGGIINNLIAVRYAGTSVGGWGLNVAYSSDIQITNSYSKILNPRALSTCYSVYILGSRNIIFNNLNVIGSRINIASVFNSTFNNTVYSDGYISTTSSIGINIFYVSDSVNIKFDGLSVPYSSCNCYLSVFSFHQVDKMLLRNVGVYSARFDCSNLSLYFVEADLGSRNIYLQRCYIINTRNGWSNFANDISGVIQDNCFSDFNDSVLPTLQGSTVRGCGWDATTKFSTSVYGSHFIDRFTSVTAGIIEILCNEPDATSSAQCKINSGSPKFNSSGSVLMTVVGQQIEWEMAYYALGHTAIANIALDLTGTSTGNLSYEFQYDLGSGYNGSWLTANATNFTAVGAIDPAVGIKIKLRVTCVTANAGNVLTNIRITTVTTSTAQSTNLYPLDTITLTLTGLVSGSDVVVRAAGTGTILASVDSNAGTTWGYVYETPVAIDVDVIKPGYVPKSLLRNYTPSAQDSSLPVSQLLDRNYI